MTADENGIDWITDFITGRRVPDTGAEANRQQVEALLVETKGYSREEIAVDAEIVLEIDGEVYRSQVDLVVSVGGVRLMAIKCAAGSLGSREREILAAARLLDRYQVPYAVVSDGRTAIVMDTITGGRIGAGLDAIPDRAGAEAQLKSLSLQPYPEERREREKLVFRSYDSMNVNVCRNLNPG